MKHPITHYLFQGIRILLIPIMLWVILGLILAGSKLTFSIGYNHSLYLAGIGFCSGLVIFSINSSPFMRLYVAGHELTHWLTAKAFRRRTGRLRIGKAEGSVSVQRPNIWIMLAPYFFPFYTVVWISVIKIIEIWYIETGLLIALYLGTGLTYAYHIFMTMLALSKEQTDLKMYGYSFSMCLIILINFFIVYCGLSLFSDNVEYSATLLKKTYISQWNLLTELFLWILQTQIYRN